MGHIGTIMADEYGVAFHNAGPSFLDRMNEDQYKRRETKMVNGMKREHSQSKAALRGRKFKDPRDMRNNNNQVDQNKVNPTVVTHEHWKTKEKGRYDDVWGPLGWCWLAGFSVVCLEPGEHMTFTLLLHRLLGKHIEY